jgi:Anaphase-promoting complex APC subunit CDC26
MLRRNPTKIELKEDDIQEYEDLKKNKQAQSGRPPQPLQPKKLTTEERIGIKK